MTDIDGKVVGAPETTTNEQAVAVVDPHASQMVSFDPLAAQPVEFKQQLVSRQENYDQLAEFMRNMLVPGKDFGRIHIAKKDKCPKPWQCSYEKQPYHWSGYSLWAPGADKVLAMLGLEATYPGYEDYIRAAVTGKQITDIIITCHLFGHGQRKIAEGMGATSRENHKGDLNNSLKIACKRARVDAVLRLPGMSALFEDDFLAQVAAEAAKKKGGNSTSARQRQPKTGNYCTGAILTVWPFQKPPELIDVRFEDMKEDTLNWIAREMGNKPDIHKAAIRVLESRNPIPQAKSGPDSTPAKEPRKSGESVTPDNRPSPAPQQQSNDDWLSEYENTGNLNFDGLEDPDEWEKQNNG